MSSVYIPSKSPEDWQRFLADPEKQWRSGFSAKTTAYSWQLSEGFPLEIKHLLMSSIDHNLQESELLLAIPEHKVYFPPMSGHPSQNDVFVIGRAGNAGLISMTVEAKVSEKFDRTVSEWISNPSSGKIERLEYLRTVLNLIDTDISLIRYQLLHRLASSIIEAKRFFARYAVMAVHSFSQDDEWFDDYSNFLHLYEVRAVLGQLHHLFDIDGISVHSGWARGDKIYLDA